MDRRWNLLLIIPLFLAVLAYALTGNIIYATVGLVAGLLLLQAFRFLALPPHLHRAVQHYRSGRLEEALRLADLAIEKNPDRWESYHLRALIHFGLTQLNRAEKDARRALELKPDAHPLHLVLGQTLFALSRYRPAAAVYEEARQYGPKDGPTHYYLGLCHYRLGDYMAAKNAFSQGLALGLENPSLNLLGHYYLGDCLTRLNRAAEAADVFAQLPSYTTGLEPLRNDLYSVANYPALPALKADLTALEAKLAQTAA